MKKRDPQPNQEFKDDIEEEIMDVQELRREIERVVSAMSLESMEFLVEHLQERESEQEIWEEEMRESRPDDQTWETFYV